MSDDDGSVMSELASRAARDLTRKQEAWLRSLGIETEADARKLAKNWVLEYSPIEVVDGGDNVKASQTVRLVRRDDTLRPRE